MESIILTRIKALCLEQGTYIKNLEDELGFSQGSINKWRSVDPTVSRLSKVAHYFGVSMEFLTGETDIRTPASEILKDEDIITIQRARESMSEKDRQRMMKMLRIGFDFAFEDEQTKELIDL